VKRMENISHSIEEMPLLEGQYIESQFQGKILKTQREVKRWLDITGVMPSKIENGDSPQLGVSGYFIHY